MTEDFSQDDPPAGRPAGSLTDLVQAPPAGPAARLSAVAAVKVCVLAAGLIGLNYWQVPTLVGQWRHDADWSYGFIIPLFSLYLIYSRWGELLRAPRRACPAGLALLLGAIALMVLGVYPLSILWVRQLSMPLMILGVVLYVGGTRLAGLTALPILYLCFALPLPTMLYRRIAVPLQDLAAEGSAGLLGSLGVDISVTASHLKLISRGGSVYPLDVVEACSGIRSLIAYVALGVAWAYLEERPVWQRVVLVAAAVPVALLTNILRVATTCCMFYLDRPELGQKFMHEVTGIVMLAPALLMLWGLGALLKRLFVEPGFPADGADP